MKPQITLMNPKDINKIANKTRIPFSCRYHHMDLVHVNSCNSVASASSEFK